MNSRAPRAARVLATWFGAGLLPKAPGTWGSAAALPPAVLLAHLGGPTLLAAAAGLLFVLGLWASAAYVRATGENDPGPVVVDEVVGQWVALLPAALDPWHYAAAFVLFRVFDVTKPWPADAIDRRVAGAPGIMLDDVVAGLYAALVIVVAIRTGVLP